ncbi:MAG: lactonase family protein [Akkermansiaceae bacterium]|jgi:hypothetical protein|nr:lactonase family protein [Akkermansiaceae bacterium]MDP4721341.1 lactonase family protein [Akkermansiaceae bacterium]MDP4779438.1 lactonase family protein [Akkermansiaceae bacterium]MDP4846778.1 lactonase family protein [Akkermansiaceae bacterium]MDP4897115.1 lactonase family protein [Akkermansiaceae bacterium]
MNPKPFSHYTQWILEWKLAGASLLCASIFSAAMAKAESQASVSIKQIGEAPTSGGLVTAVVYEKNGRHFLYTGGEKSELESFTVGDDGTLNPLKSYALWNNKGPARGLVTVTLDGTDYLYAGNKFGNAIEVYRIDEDGMLDRIHLIEDTDQTHLGVVITLQVVEMKSATYLLAGGLEKTPGLSCFRVNKDGSLTHVQSMKDTEEIYTDGIIGMVLHRIAGKTYVVTGGFQDSGVSSFCIDEDGRFENVSNVGDDLELFLNGTYPVDGVTLGDQAYVLVGHRHHNYYKRGGFIKNPDFVYHGDGVTVLKMDQTGSLTVHHVLKNTPELRLRGQTRLAVRKLSEEQALVVVGTREDQSLQACLLGQDGRLVPLGHSPTGFEIYNGMTSAEIAGRFYVFAGPVPGLGSGVRSFRIDLPHAPSP